MPLKQKLSALLLICFAPLIQSATFHQTTNNPKLTQALTELQQLGQEIAQEDDIASISIGLVNNKGLVWSSSFGYADYENNILATENTVYRAGSLAKTLTATAILQLEEDGLIDIDQAISAYLPRFHIKSRFSSPGVITPRSLITHHSGIPTDINKGFWTEQRFTELVEDLRSEYLSYPANFIKNYSNLGYSLLGSIIENSSNTLYEDYIKERIFKPLSMNNSHFKPYGDDSAHYAIGYKQGVPKKNLPIRDSPALGLNTSVSDYAHFLSALLNQGRYVGKTLLFESSVNDMFSVQNTDVLLDMDNKIGLPWLISQLNAENAGIIASHSGTTINFSSEVMLLPKQGLAMVLLSNSNAVNGRLKFIGQTFFKSIISALNFATLEYKVVTPVPHLHQQSSTAQSHYVSDRGMVKISQDKGELCDCNTQNTLDLIPMPNGWFAVNPNDGVTKTKIKEEVVNGVPVLVVEKNGKKEQIGSLVNVKKDISNTIDWQQHYGGYQLVNPDQAFPVTDIRIFSVEDTTYMCYKMPKLSDQLVVLPLQPISEHEAITQGLGRSKGETVYLQKIDGQSVLTYSGFVAEKIKEQ